MISVVYSTEHLLMPKIIGTLLVILLAVIILVEGRARKAKTGKFFGTVGKFFRDNADYKKLFGTLILFIGYILAVEEIGFTVTSIIFVFLFNVLYTGWSKKALRTSIIISIAAPLIVSLIFGVAFNITLPGGACSVTFVDYGFTIY
jgi:putative tricarboxylic transport membrane protein